MQQSRYLVGGQVLRQVKQDRFEWRSFLAKRLSRMWTVLIPGLIVTATTSVVFAHTYGAPSVGPAAQAQTGPTTYLCNVFFGQEARCTPAGSNDSLWSLSYEFWFYVIFASLAVCVSAVARRKAPAAALNLVVAMLAILYFTPLVLLFAVSWLYGAVAAQWSRDRELPQMFTARHSVAAWAVLVGVAMTASTVLGMPRVPMFMLVGVPATGLILAGTVARPATDRFRMRVGASLGTSSFTMYVFHLPLVAFVARMLTEHSFGDSPLELTAAVYVVCILAVPVSTGLWWLFERHTPRIRDGLFKLFLVPQPTSAHVTSTP